MSLLESERIKVGPSARPLLKKLPENYLDGTISALKSSAKGIKVSSIRVRRSLEPEDPSWEELVFDVRVEANSREALAYWDRIGAALDRFVEQLREQEKQEFAAPIGVHVHWR